MMSSFHGLRIGVVPLVIGRAAVFRCNSHAQVRNLAGHERQFFIFVATATAAAEEDDQCCHRSCHSIDSQKNVPAGQFADPIRCADSGAREKACSIRLALMFGSRPVGADRRRAAALKRHPERDKVRPSRH